MAQEVVRGREETLNRSPPVDPSDEAQERELFHNLLERWSDGDSAALDDLFQHFFSDLRRTARHLLRGEHNRPLDTTELVSEVYLKLRQVVPEGFENTGAFFGLYARKARQFLVDQARARDAKKRGGDFTRVNLETRHGRHTPEPVDLLALDEVLSRLEGTDPRMAEVAHRKIFVRMREREIAEDLDVSRATVQRDWAFARRWIVKELG